MHRTYAVSSQVNGQNLVDFVRSVDQGGTGAALHLKLWFSGYHPSNLLRLLTEVLPDMPAGCYDFQSVRMTDLEVMVDCDVRIQRTSAFFSPCNNRLSLLKKPPPKCLLPCQ